MSKSPGFWFFTGDWMKDTELRFCSIFARGLLVDLLCLMFESAKQGYLCRPDGSARTDTEIVNSISGGSEQEKLNALNELVASGVLSRDEQGVLYSRRLSRLKDVSEQKRRAGSKGGSKTQAQRKQTGKQDGKHEDKQNGGVTDSVSASDSVSVSYSTGGIDRKTIFGEIHIPDSLTDEEIGFLKRWIDSMQHDHTFETGSSSLEEKFQQAARYKKQGSSVEEMASRARAGQSRYVFPIDHRKPKAEQVDYEQHPEWLAILQIMREHGRDEMTDDVEWRSKNMTKAQKKAKLEAFSSWEELERANRFDRKSIAKDYVLAFERLQAQGVPHK